MGEGGCYVLLSFLPTLGGRGCHQPRGIVPLLKNMTQTLLPVLVSAENTQKICSCYWVYFVDEHSAGCYFESL